MALIIATEDSMYRCNACGNLLAVKKGQLLPPCPRCGGLMVKAEDGAPQQGPSCCS
jgi:predicted RNA-binding Zn-ribbon protein involved in translation (DUF1610 family)